jgi:hypothetical protein
MFTTVEWWGSFLANFLADTTVAILIGIVLTVYLRRREETLKAHKQRQEALTLLREELAFNSKQLKLATDQLPRRHLVFPLFSITVGEVAINRGLIRGHDVSLETKIRKLYSDLAEINWLNKLLFEKSFDRLLKDGTFLIPEEVHDWHKIYIVDPLQDEIREELDELLKLINRLLGRERA